jgi:DNA-binding transcriptional ArsR family regulator
MAHISNATSRERAFEAEAALCLRLLGDDNRLHIFSLLTKAEMCVCEIEDATQLSNRLEPPGCA